MSQAKGSPSLSRTPRASWSSANVRTAPYDGDEVEIGHAPPEQRVAVAEVVTDVQPGHHPGESRARLVHLEELGDGVAQGLGAVVERRSATDAIVVRSTRAATG